MLVLVLTDTLRPDCSREKPDFFIEIPPLRVPSLGNIVMKTLSRIEWYLKEAVPLFLLGTLILFSLDKLKLLGRLEELVFRCSEFFGLPAKICRGAHHGVSSGGLWRSGNVRHGKQGLLNENQVIVSLVTLTLFVPCLANFFMIIKERGVKTALLMMALYSRSHCLSAVVLNFILN